MKHHLIGIGKYQIEHWNGNPIFRSLSSIMPDEPIHARLKQYFYKVLDAIELKNGFCHAEIFSTKEGLFVIDINPRLPGASNSICLLVKETSGYSHMDVFGHVLLNKSVVEYKHAFGQIICLQNTVPGIINSINREKLIALPSFKHCISNNKEGQTIDSPKHLSDTIAFIVLAHEDLKQLQIDAAKVFFLEKNRELF